MNLDKTCDAVKVPLPAAEGPIPVTSSSMPFNSAARQVTPIDLHKYGYCEEEYFLSGKANVYKWDQPGPAEIRMPAGPYTNRTMVRKPTDPNKFSGNVFLEVLNSTSTYDSQPLWYACHDKFLRDGDIYVGITSKPIAIKALKKYNPIRYAPLSWDNPLPPEQRGNNPGDYMPLGIAGSFPETEDGLIWDIVSQTGALLKSDSSANPLNGYGVEKIYAIGASQSANLLTTYINAIQTVAVMPDGKPIFDGFLLTVGAYPLPINQDAPIVLPPGDSRVVIRNCRVPVIRFMSQSDFRSMGPWPFLSARREDSDALTDRFRLYEVPGAAHTNYYTVDFRSGPAELTPLDIEIPHKPDYYPNDFPSHYLFMGALVNLDRWVREGTPPPRAARIQIDERITQKDQFGNEVPAILKDGYGNATGGLRTPYLDIPIATYTAYTDADCLGGKLLYFQDDLEKQLYQSHEYYFRLFSAKVDEMVESGWIMAVDGERMKQKQELKGVRLFPGTGV